MVGLVIVSHSAALADGVTELAREMGGGDVAIEAAGGIEGGEIGTDAERVRQAVERVRSPDGVLILMDLGSALMSAEMATEMAEPAGGPILLSEAPLVEGAVAAAALAGAGASLEEVAREARGALRMKTEQLGIEEVEREEAPPTVQQGGPAVELRLHVQNRLGLHARPAARFVRAIADLDARVEVSNASRTRGPADGRSLTGLATLAVAQGDEIVVLARGPQAAGAVEALRALAAVNFGDAAEDEPAGAGTAGGAELESASRVGAAEAPGPGTRLRGVPASPGIAIGPARRLRPREPVVQDDPAGTPAEERARLDAARAAAREELEEVRATVAARGGAAAADIFSAHALLLDDAAITEPALRHIEEGTGAARAWQAAAEKAAAAFRALEDPYLRERAVDVEDVSRRVLARLGGTASAAALEGPGIVLADELTPGEAAGLDPDNAWAIATARGGATAHAAILARALGIPAVVGLGEALRAIAEATPLVLDGDAGFVDVDPGDEAVADLQERQEAADAQRRALLTRAAEPGALRDGPPRGSLREHRQHGRGRPRRRAGCRGRRPAADRVPVPRPRDAAGRGGAGRDPERDRWRVGRPPGGGPHARRGSRQAAAVPAPGAGEQPVPRAPRHQALARRAGAAADTATRHPARGRGASAEGDVPDGRDAGGGAGRAGRCSTEARAGLGSSAELEVGVMVEVPALALQAAQFAPEVDFFSIGTNDLAQYTMAAERGNAALAGLLEARGPRCSP